MEFSRKILIGIVTTLALSAMLAAGCSGGGGTVIIGGSTTVQPLSESWTEAFIADNPDVEISVQGGGSSAGVKGAADGTLDIGAASREMKSEEASTFPNLVVHHVAADGVAIIVHPGSAVADLTLAEIRDIFAAGSSDEWTVINREEGSGTREVYEEIVMDGVKVAPNAEFLPSNGAVKQKVASTENAIGYISLGYVDSSVKAVKVDGVVCSEDNVINGSYPVMRYLNYITDGEPDGTVKDYIDFCLSSTGQQIAADEGYIKLS
jgi:phosphate transport system substrate-binding protein